MNYQQQANDFATATGTKLKINRSDYGYHFTNDKENRYIFNCTLTRKGKRYTFNFGQSIAAGNIPPTMYDVLTCLTKYDPETFEYFCREYGYDTDSIKALETYKAVQREFNGVNRLFADVLEQLQEIQ
jgi:hypothetical protein